MVHYVTKIANQSIGQLYWSGRGYGLDSMSTKSGRKRIAVVGGGVAGLVTAWLLESAHDVGAIVITSSVAGLRSMCPQYSLRSHGLAGYTAAKHGVVGLMRYYATALAERNIRVNTVHPTGLASPMTGNGPMQQFLAENSAAVQAVHNLLPVAMIDAADVTETMVHLCGRSGRYITGINLPVDAGYTAK